VTGSTLPDTVAAVSGWFTPNWREDARFAGSHRRVAIWMAGAPFCWISENGKASLVRTPRGGAAGW